MKPQFGRAVVGGLVGTIAMTLLMLFVAPMMGVHMDIAKSLAALMGSSHAVGLAVHSFKRDDPLSCDFRLPALRNSSWQRRR